MPNYAIAEDDMIVNVIVADTPVTAEAVTGLEAIEVQGGAPWIGWTLESEGWRSPRPFPSWDWDGTAWAAPVPYPADEAHYYWDEEQGDWTKYPVPEPVTE
jgi:hypothetical protein